MRKQAIRFSYQNKGTPTRKHDPWALVSEGRFPDALKLLRNRGFSDDGSSISALCALLRRQFIGYPEYAALGGTSQKTKYQINHRYYQALRAGDTAFTDWVETFMDQGLAKELRVPHAVCDGRYADGLMDMTFDARREGIQSALTVEPEQGRALIRLEHIPFTRNLVANYTLLEMGFGEIFMQMRLLRFLCQRTQTHTVLTVQKYIPLATILAKGCNISVKNVLDITEAGTPAHMGMDILSKYLIDSGTLRIEPLFPKASPNTDQTYVGITWRGGMPGVQTPISTRSFPLERLIEMLPKGPKYVALQHDITEKELSYLTKQGVVGINGGAINHPALLSAARNLSGIISVESSTLHLAGHFQIPSIAIMPKHDPYAMTWHWYQKSEFRSPFPRDLIEPVAPNLLTREVIADWLSSAVGRSG